MNRFARTLLGERSHGDRWFCCGVSPPGDSVKTEASLLDVSLEAMAVVAPLPHVGFLLGKTADVPVAGSGKYTVGSVEQDPDEVRVTSLGLHAGIFVWF